MRPVPPQTGATRARLWWWLIPVTLLTAAFDLRVKGTLDGWWAAIFPFLSEPPGWALGSALATPEARSHLVGAWGTGGLSLLNALFNTFLGEELLFRGFSSPRTARVFARTDWVANGILLVCTIFTNHGHVELTHPWRVVVCFAEPTLSQRPVRNLAHSGQSIFFAVLMLLLILGLT